MEVYARAAERGMAYGSRATFSITLYAYVLNAFISLGLFSIHYSSFEPFSFCVSITKAPFVFDILCL